MDGSFNPTEVTRGDKKLTLPTHQVQVQQEELPDNRLVKCYINGYIVFKFWLNIYFVNLIQISLNVFQSGEIERGAGGGYSSSTSSSSASETRLDGRTSGRGSSGGRDSLNVILGAAQGPGDYHGTMSKAELEREAGGRIFTSEDSETRSQVESTRYQGAGGAGYQGSRTSGGSESYQGSRTASTGGSESYQGSRTAATGSGYGGGRSSSSQEYGSSSGGYRGGYSSGRQGSTTVTQGYRVDGGRAVDDYDAQTDDSYQGSYGRGQQSSSGNNYSGFFYLRGCL